MSCFAVFNVFIELLERDILFILNIIFVVYFNYGLAGFDSR